MARKPEDGFDPSRPETGPDSLDLADIDPTAPSKSRPPLTPAEAVELEAEAERPLWSPDDGRTAGMRRKANGRRRASGNPKKS